MSYPSGVCIELTDIDVYPPNETTIATADVASSFVKATDTVLEVGTGSGYIAIAIAKAMPTAAVHASDINPRAVEAAKANSKANGTAIEVHLSDMFSAIPTLSFDLIVSHPPAVPYLSAITWGMSEGMTIATNGGNDGSDLVCRTVAESAAKLSKDGSLILGLPHWSNTGNAFSALNRYFSDVRVARTVTAKFFPVVRGNPSPELLAYIRTLNESGTISIDFSKDPPESNVSIVIASFPKH